MAETTKTIPPDPYEVESARKPLHGAILRIDRRTFAMMLDLPPDVNVAAVYEDPTTAGLVLHLIGDSLPEVPADHRPAQAEITFQAKYTDDDGQWWRRLRFHVLGA